MGSEEKEAKARRMRMKKGGETKYANYGLYQRLEKVYDKRKKGKQFIMFISQCVVCKKMQVKLIERDTEI